MNTIPTAPNTKTSSGHPLLGAGGDWVGRLHPARHSDVLTRPHERVRSDAPRSTGPSSMVISTGQRTPGSDDADRRWT